MKLYNAIAILLAVALTPQAQAQTEPPSRPPGILLQLRAPAISQWTVTCYPSKTPANAEAENKTASDSSAVKSSQFTTVTKTKNIIHEQVSMPNGQRKETWTVGGLQFLTLPGSTEREVKDCASIARVRAENFTYTDFSKTDFPGLENLTPDDYVGTSKVMGRECIVLRKETPAAPKEDRMDLKKEELDIEALTQPLPSSEKDKTNLVACVDLQIRLPILVEQDGEKRIYQFGAPPQAMLTLPKDIQQDLERRAREREQMGRMPARPY